MNNTNDSTVHRGDIFYADLSPVVGWEQGGLRPVLIIQNDVGNMHSPTVIVGYLTAEEKRNIQCMRKLCVKLHQPFWESKYILCRKKGLANTYAHAQKKKCKR